MQKNPARQLIVCEAAPTKKADSAAKRARQAEKRRVYNKSKKSEARTRMKKVHLILPLHFVYTTSLVLLKKKKNKIERLS